MATETQTIQSLISETGITMTAERVDRNPHMDSQDMDHWKCKFVGRNLGMTRMTVYFSKGYGHKGAEPEISEVLDCLASDAAGFSNAPSFEDWASEYGYDTDSRKAEKTFKAVLKASACLEQFLGHDYYNTLLWDVERQ